MSRWTARGASRSRSTPEARQEQGVCTAWVHSRYTGEVLAGQGEMGDPVDRRRPRLVSSGTPVIGHVPPSIAPRFRRAFAVTPAVSFAAWWRYWGTSEEASALA